MANITIYVESLLNAAQYDPYTVSDAITVNALKVIVSAALGIDSSWYNLSFNEIVLVGTSTLVSNGLVTGSRLGAGNIIARLPTLQDRQLAKLNLAALDRTASGNPRNIYDITQLPTQYVGNVVVDNPNPGGLVLGRPWHS